MSWSLKIKFNMLLKSCLDKNLEDIKDWKALKLHNGINFKIYHVNTIEFSSLSTIIKHINLL